MPGGSMRFASCRTPCLALGVLLAGCSEPNQPLSPKSYAPQLSQTAANGGAGKITFQSNRNGNFDIFVMNADGSGVTQLTSHPFDEYLPLFSPDGSRIAFARCLVTCDIVLINADGSGERTILNDGFPGAWSPDGNRIALGGAAGTGIEGIYVVNVDGSGLVRVLDQSASVHIHDIDPLDPGACCSSQSDSVDVGRPRPREAIVQNRPLAASIGIDENDVARDETSRECDP